MLGVVNKAIEAFVCQRYGDKLWADLLIDLSLPGYEFEAMLTYEDGITYDLNDRVALALDILEMPLIRVLRKKSMCVWPQSGTGSVMFWCGCYVRWRMITAC